MKKKVFGLLLGILMIAGCKKEVPDNLNVIYGNWANYVDVYINNEHFAVGVLPDSLSLHRVNVAIVSESGSIRMETIESPCR
jgi:hypothetical protein